jgi:glycosyltransferase involved in cell wall biosynthesis
MIHPLVSALTWGSLIGLGCMVGIGALNLLTARRLSRAGEPAWHPRVSLLIPARDEADNLAETLPLALRSIYPDLEILVLDDGSTDDTTSIIASHAERDPALQLLRGSTPPAGWLGKSWACEQLAAAATGEVFIFCDADVRIGPEAVARSVALLQSTGAGLMTALPRQLTPGWIEAAVIPLIAQLPVLALLPLRLVERSASPALSMANGQWMAFTRDAYRAAGGHRAVRGEVLEDVALGRIVKRSGHRLAVALAPDDLAVRMYTSTTALRHGFRKNLFALGGGRLGTFALVVATFGATMLFPLVAPLVAGAAGTAALVLLITLRGLVAAATRHDARGALLHPIGAPLAAAMAIDSALAARGGTAVWKGRAVALGTSPRIAPTHSEEG